MFLLELKLCVNLVLNADEKFLRKIVDISNFIEKIRKIWRNEEKTRFDNKKTWRSRFHCFQSCSWYNRFSCTFSRGGWNGFAIIYFGRLATIFHRIYGILGDKSHKNIRLTQLLAISQSLNLPIDYNLTTHPAYKYVGSTTVCLSRLWLYIHNTWTCQSLDIKFNAVADLHYNILYTPGPFFFIFKHFSGKFGWIIGWRPPPLGNPGSTPTM